MVISKSEVEKSHIKIVKFEVKNLKLKICVQILELIKKVLTCLVSENISSLLVKFILIFDLPIFLICSKYLCCRGRLAQLEKCLLINPEIRVWFPAQKYVNSIFWITLVGAMRKRILHSLSQQKGKVAQINWSYEGNHIL